MDSINVLIACICLSVNPSVSSTIGGAEICLPSKKSTLQLNKKDKDNSTSVLGVLSPVSYPETIEGETKLNQQENWVCYFERFHFLIVESSPPNTDDSPALTRSIVDLSYCLYGVTMSGISVCIFLQLEQQ